MLKQFYLTHRWTLTGTTTQGQSGTRSNGNERGTPHSPKLQDWCLTI